MHPITKLSFFNPSKTSKEKDMKVKAFSHLQEKEMGLFCKELRRKGRYYSHSIVEGEGVLKYGQLDLLDSNLETTKLHIIKYI